MDSYGDGQIDLTRALRARLNFSPLDSSHLSRLRERQALCSGFPRGEGGGTFVEEAILRKITPRYSESWWFWHALAKGPKAIESAPQNVPDEAPEPSWAVQDVPGPSGGFWPVILEVRLERFEN